MSMDFSVYIESIIQKMKDANYYTEVKEDKLKAELELYLTKEYNKRVEKAAFEYDIAKAKGQPQDIDFVKERLSEIKIEIISLIRELSKTKL